MTGIGGRSSSARTDKPAPDFRAKGMLRYVGKRYLQFAQTGEFFIKGGADSPENFLAYADFDGTYDTEELTREGEAAGREVHPSLSAARRGLAAGRPHLEGRQGQGHHRCPELPGLQGHEQRLLPHLQHRRRRRQGRLALDRSQRASSASIAASWTSGRSSSRTWTGSACMLHVVTQETENDQGLDGGELGRAAEALLPRADRPLRPPPGPGLEPRRGEHEHRPRSARPSPSTSTTWTPTTIRSSATPSPASTTRSTARCWAIAYFEGPSLQTNDTHGQTIKWIDRSAAAGRPWFVCLDEIGPSHTGVKPDNDDYRARRGAKQAPLGQSDGRRRGRASGTSATASPTTT